VKLSDRETCAHDAHRDAGGVAAISRRHSQSCVAGFRKMGTPPRAVATLMAKVMREQTGPFLTTGGGCYREEERIEFANALDAGQLDATLAEILGQETGST
jgi:hypothetical protein